MTQKSIKIGVITASAIVAANMVGTGVFTSLGFQVPSINSGFSILFLWFLGGLVALSGAFSYAELGAALPRSGGEYHFLSKIYHPFVGFLTGWISVSVGFAAPIAAAAMAMGKYSSQVMIDLQWVAESSQDIAMRGIGIIIVIIVSLIHLSNVKVIGAFQNFFTALKVSLILVLVIFGFVLAKGQDISFLPNDNFWTDVFSAPFAVSLVFVMYAYSGWNAATYIIDEIKQPAKNLPMALFVGTVTVVLLYVPLNAVFLYAAPTAEMEWQEEVGYIAASYIFGNTGGIVMGLLISIGLISAVSSMVWAGPRVTQVMGEDTKLLSFIAFKNKNGVPAIAIFVQLAIVLALILTSSFQSIIIYIGFTLSLSSFLTVLGVFVLRIKQPNLERPYKTWGYPITPIFFLLVTGWMMIYVLKDKPIESLAGLATIIIGAILYYVNKHIEKK